MGVEGGAPTRYEVTNRGQLALSPWLTNPVTISYMNLGSNFIGNLEVVSQLNLFNQAHHMYHFNHPYCTERYYPRVYIGTTQTVSDSWLFDRQIYAGSDIKIPENWPINGPQKGEAN